MKRESVNKTMNLLLVATLLLVVAGLVFLLSKISFLFSPITTFISTITGPFLIAGFLYYLLQPLVKLLHKLHVRGRSANVVAFVMLVVILSGALAYIIPQLVGQVASLINHLPDFMRQLEGFVRDFADSKLATELHLDEILDQVSFDKINKSELVKFASSTIGSGANTFGAVAGHIGNALVNIFMAPLVLFYFMKDGHKLSANIQRFFAPSWRGFVANLLTKTNQTMENYFTGQFTDMLIVGILSYVGYAISGTPYALIIGMTAGVMNMVPYIGPWLGAIPAVLVAMTVSWTQVLFAVIVAIAVQQIDNNFVYPNVIGKSMEIHPLTVLVLLLTAGNMFGLLGVILGIPVYAVVKTALRVMVDEPRLHFFSYMREPAAATSAETPEVEDEQTDK